MVKKIDIVGYEISAMLQCTEYNLNYWYILSGIFVILMTQRGIF